MIKKTISTSGFEETRVIFDDEVITEFLKSHDLPEEITDPKIGEKAFRTALEEYLAGSLKLETFSGVANKIFWIDGVKNNLDWSDQLRSSLNDASELYFYRASDKAMADNMETRLKKLI